MKRFNLKRNVGEVPHISNLLLSIEEIKNQNWHLIRHSTSILIWDLTNESIYVLIDDLVRCSIWSLIRISVRDYDLTEKETQKEVI